MSTVIWPTGPEPPGVYWRRLIIVIVVLLLILILLWWLIFGRSSGGGDAGPEPTPTPAPTSESASPTPDPGPTSQSPSPSPTDTKPVECLEESILVEASAEEAIYPVGSTPTLTLMVTNIGMVACKRDIGPGANELQITSGDWRVWSSDDCNPSDEKDIITLDRGEAFETQLAWDGYLSEAGCPPDMPMAEAGEYTVIGRNGEITSAPSALRLE
ncbi:MAG: hypothetical protein ACKOMX_01305 [Actinomycetota bacterium]